MSNTKCTKPNALNLTKIFWLNSMRNTVQVLVSVVVVVGKLMMVLFNFSFFWYSHVTNNTLPRQSLPETEKRCTESVPYHNSDFCLIGFRFINFILFFIRFYFLSKQNFKILPNIRPKESLIALFLTKPFTIWLIQISLSLSLSLSQKKKRKKKKKTLHSKCGAYLENPFKNPGCVRKNKEGNKSINHPSTTKSNKSNQMMTMTLEGVCFFQLKKNPNWIILLVQGDWWIVVTLVIFANTS